MKDLVRPLSLPSIVMFGSGMSSDMLDSFDSFQFPLNMLEKYPD